MQVKFVDNKYNTALFYKNRKLMDIPNLLHSMGKLILSDDAQTAVHKQYIHAEIKVIYRIFNYTKCIILSTQTDPLLHIKRIARTMTNQYNLSEVLLTNDIIIIVNIHPTYMLCQYMDVTGVIYDYQIIHINGVEVMDIISYVNKDKPFLDIKMYKSDNLIYHLIDNELICEKNH